MAAAIVFDDRTPTLAPLADLRASFEIRTGARTTLERLAASSPAPIRAVATPNDIASVVETRCPFPVNQPAPEDDVLLLNGRCPLLPQRVDELPANAALTEAGTDAVIAARLGADDAEAFLGSGDLPAGVARRRHEAPCLLNRPWDVIRFRDAAIERDLADLAARSPHEHPHGVITFGPGPISIDPTATVFPTAVLDGERGPIVIAAGATVRPGAVISGPAAIGEGATVVERAHIRGATVVGPVCKVGGEVGGVIFQGYSNKAHDGYLGDSWVGEWVNLGAATVGSNLLNTYGEVRSQLAPGAPREATGLTFFGAVVGDHVKTAIGTRLMTGAVVGTGAMIACSEFAPPALDAFHWLTDRGETVYDIERFIVVAQRMAERRGAGLDKAMIDRIRALHLSVIAQRA